MTPPIDTVLEDVRGRSVHCKDPACNGPTGTGDQDELGELGEPDVFDLESLKTSQTDWAWRGNVIDRVR